MIYFFHLPKRVLQRLDKFRSRFFKQEESKKKEISTGQMNRGSPIKGGKRA
jgi:hypothetical protein